MSMDIQADIKWIQSELVKIQDPELISAFKSLLKCSLKQKQAESELDKSLARAKEDMVNGRVKSHDEVREKYQQWL
jgi:ppGpp synthetase/RelA/SpoT-type nucleotidyltranferase